MRRPGLLSLLTTILALVTGCDIMSPGRDFDALEEARARWEALGVQDYSWTVRRACYCGGAGLAVVTVEDGEVVAVVYAESGEPAPETAARWFPTVDELLDQAERALREADAVEVRYDDETGAPLLLDVDWIADAIDDEVRWESTRPEW